jgi:hypothetical protein
MENNIPTAEEWIKKHYEEDVKNHFIGFSRRQNVEQTYKEYAEIYPLKKLEDTMIEFAKLHVEAALKKASENAIWDSISNDIGFGGSAGYDFIDTDYAGDPCTGYKISVNKDSIINAYPLDKIK